MTTTTVTTIANLQTLTGSFSNGDIALVGGYSAVGDGGGGTFCFEASSSVPPSATIVGAGTSGVTITGATNASPIVIAATAHGYVTGQVVTVSGIIGNTAANGTWTVTVVDANHYSLNGSAGNGAYISGGATLSGTTVAVTAATNASPIAITTAAAHSYATGQVVAIAGVLGNTAANGTWTVTVTSATGFTLNASTGSGTYTANTGTANTIPLVTSAAHGLPIGQLVMIGGGAGQSYNGAMGGICLISYATGTAGITGATNASPISITAPSHHYSTGQVVAISNVDGNTNANGTWGITFVDSNTFTLNSASITGATDASPIAITTSAPHSYSIGQVVAITGVGGNTAANGTWTITVTGPSTFTLNGSTGNAAYTSGGTSASAGNAAYTSGGLAAAAPITVTTTVAHGYTTGQTVEISGVSGNIGAIGTWTVTAMTSTTFTLNGSTGYGVYASGGTSCAATTFSIGAVWTAGWASSSALIGDGGTAIPSTAVSGRWCRMFSGSLDVRWFGASTSVADNTTAFNYAINAANVGYGSVVYAPAGTYAFTTSAPLTTISSGGLISDPGGRATLSFSPGVNGDCVVAKGVYLTLRNLYINNYNITASVQSATLHIKNCAYGHFSDLTANCQGSNSICILLEQVLENASDAYLLAHIGCWYNVFETITCIYISVGATTGVGLQFSVNANAQGVVNPPGQAAGTYTGTCQFNIVRNVDIEAKTLCYNLVAASHNTFIGGVLGGSGTYCVAGVGCAANTFINLRMTYAVSGGGVFNLDSGSIENNILACVVYSPQIIPTPANPWSWGNLGGSPSTGPGPVLLTATDSVNIQGLLTNTGKLYSAAGAMLVADPTLGDGTRIDSAGNVYAIPPVSGLALWLRSDLGVTPGMGAVSASGTTPPTVTLAGYSSSMLSLEIDIMTGGALGTAQFQFKINGVVQAANLVTGSNVALGAGTLTAQFSAGTYNSNNVYSANVNIASWADQSAMGAANSVAVAQSVVANQPAYSPNGGVNGLAKLSYALGQSLHNTTWNVLSAGTSRTLFVVAKPTNVVGGTLFTFRTGTAGGNIASFGYSNSSGTNYCYSDGVHGASNAIFPGSSLPATGVVQIYVATYSTSATLGYSLNGVVQAVSETADPTSDTGTTGFTVGNNDVSGGGWVGDYYEVLVYGSILSTAVQNQVLQYLAKRYGVAIA